MKIISVAQMKAAECYAIEHGISALRLMENAGTAAAGIIAEIVLEAFAQKTVCAVVCGAGNNGGDGFVVARRLHEAGHTVTVVLAAGGYPDAPKKGAGLLIGNCLFFRGNGCRRRF